MEPTRIHHMQSASPWKTYWFFSFTGSLMWSIGQALSRSALVWASLPLTCMLQLRPQVMTVFGLCTIVSCGIQSFFPLCSKCIFEKECKRMQHTPPLTFIVCPPPSIPPSSSPALLSGSIRICICNALHQRPLFGLKKLAFSVCASQVNHTCRQKLFCELLKKITPGFLFKCSLSGANTGNILSYVLVDGLWALLALRFRWKTQ